ncbi:Cytochrome P450 family protein [Quillaja saponaria]|uniref:Cytochrome P450 family protein n=1 Tax=Quillaja saponaria TaxID=32244 RepID=A0AAD7M583_QUISA|nr:Cytochrome P450 family protein [Quillaja saponaria]
MEFFWQPVLLLFVIFLASSYFVHQRKIGGTKNLPPGSLGWPLVGETLQFICEKYENFFRKRMKKYSSEVFKTSILEEPTIVFCGPDANKHISANEPKLVKVWYPKSQISLFNMHLGKYQSPNPSTEMKKVTNSPVRMMGLLKPEGVMKHLGKIESITKQHIRTQWEGKEEVKVFMLVKALVLNLSCQFFLGLDDPDLASKLVVKFDHLQHGVQSVPVNFPGTTYNRALKAAATIREEIQLIIKEKSVSNVDIYSMIMGLMLASYMSVSNVITFMIKHIGQRPDIYQKIASEQTEISRSRGSCKTLDWESIQKMKYTWAVAQETMRLHPPTPSPFREAVADFTFGAFTIPKGWKILWAVNAANMSPEYFPDPENFDPSRFEGNGPAPYTFVPFGGGPRTCPGKDYARIVILTVIHNLVTKFKWEVLFPDEKITGTMLPIPAKGLPIRLHPI